MSLALTSPVKLRIGGPFIDVRPIEISQPGFDIPARHYHQGLFVWTAFVGERLPSSQRARRENIALTYTGPPL